MTRNDEDGKFSLMLAKTIMKKPLEKRFELSTLPSTQGTIADSESRKPLHEERASTNQE
jgi:hypothetical protein